MNENTALNPSAIVDEEELMNTIKKLKKYRKNEIYEWHSKHEL